jgi:hypothetical protein
MEALKSATQNPEPQTEFYLPTKHTKGHESRAAEFLTTNQIDADGNHETHENRIGLLNREAREGARIRRVRGIRAGDGSEVERLVPKTLLL